MDKPTFPKPAATLILTRQYDGELQVYLLKRSSKSAFMAGSFVFPGGRVDPNDRKDDIWIRHVDMSSEDIAERFGEDVNETSILSFGVSVIRETLEEAGVFLAHRRHPAIDDIRRICKLRLSDKLSKDWFIDLVVAERWILNLSQLMPLSHWITPVLMPYRFDTRFYLAAVPEGQECCPDARETVEGLWLSPLKALNGNLAGTIPLSPPTLVTLHGLLNVNTIEELQPATAHRKWGRPIMPRLVPVTGGAVIVEPWDPEYGQEEIDIRPDKLAAAVLGASEPFSRLWLHGGIWRAIDHGP